MTREFEYKEAHIERRCISAQASSTAALDELYEVVLRDGRRDVTATVDGQVR